MEDEVSNNINPWTGIPLDDYERHMQHKSVGQLSLLNALTKKWLEKCKPETCLFMGIAGGNGLEYVDNAITRKVLGIDINQEYLDSCYNRFKNKIDDLTLSKIDITKSTSRICQADFIWAALILEYTGIQKSFEFAANNIRSGGNFIVTIQSNNHLQAVSPTGVESIKKVGSISKEINPKELLEAARQLRFDLLANEENNLPNGKSFLTYHLVYK